MANDAPNYDELLDKGFGAPRTVVADKATPEQAEEPAPEVVEDKAPEAPIEQPGSGEGTEGTEEVWTRALFNRKMHEVGEERRKIEAERARLADLQRLADEMEADPEYANYLAQQAEAYRTSRANQPEAPAALPPAVLSRIQRLEQALAQRSQQDNIAAVNAESSRISREYGFDAKDTAAMIQKAVDAGLLDYNTPPHLVGERLSMVAASIALPKAKANGQRELLGQIKNKGAVASPATERPAPPDPEPDVSKMKESEYVAHLVRLAEKGAGAS